MLRFILHLAKWVSIVHLNQILNMNLLRRMNERRLIKTVINAYTDVPYYKEKYDAAGVDIKSIRTIADLQKLPFLTKDEVRKNFPQYMVARGTDLNKSVHSFTTGSTGRPLHIIYSRSTWAFYIATGVRMYTMIGYRPWHKIAYIKHTKLDYPRLGPFFRTAHIKSMLSPEEQIEMLRQISPDLIIGYASIIYDIAKRLTAWDLNTIKPKLIGINSEFSTQAQRDFISHVFGCPVYDEYSTEETWMIASQCRHHNYHIFTDNVWVEFLNPNGQYVGPNEIGEIVLTTTRSPTMPFIRYRIGDLGSYSDEPCSCGLGFPLLASLDGRADDDIILPSGKRVSSIKILNTLYIFNIKKYRNSLDEFKVVQLRTDLIAIQIVKGKDFKHYHLNELLYGMKKLFDEEMMIEIVFVEKIGKIDGIKRKAVESLIK